MPPAGKMQSDDNEQARTRKSSAQQPPMTYRTFGSLFTKFKEAFLRFPRKGRLRFFLALIVAVSGFKIAGALLASSGDTAGTLSGAGKKACSQTAGTALDFNAVASLLAQCQPRLICDRDTFQADGISVVVWYSLDTALQNFIGRMLKQYRPRYGAMVVMNARSGRVLSMVSYRHDSLPDLGSRMFLRSIFPAASIYKIVTAAAAIETARYSATTPVPVAGRNHTLYRSQIRKTISPWNELPFEDAFAYSINPAFARIGMYVVGRETLEEYGRRFGFNARIPFELAADSSKVLVPDDTSYAMAELASGYNRRTTLSPLHGALIAGTVVEDGAMPEPRLVDSICRTDGQCLYRSQPQVWKNSMRSATACELQTMMNRVVEVGTCRKTFRLLRRCAWSQGIEYGGKTGSIDVDSMGKIDWFIGFAVDRDEPDRSLAVGIVTVHGRLWTVHSSYLGAEIFRKALRPAPHEQMTKKQSARTPSASAPVVNKPKG